MSTQQKAIGERHRELFIYLCLQYPFCQMFYRLSREGKVQHKGTQNEGQVFFLSWLYGPPNPLSPSASLSLSFPPSSILLLWQMTMQENLCWVLEITTLSQAKQSPPSLPLGNNCKSLWMWCMGQDPFLKKQGCCYAGTSLDKSPWRARWRHSMLDGEHLARKLILGWKEELAHSLKTSVLNDLRLPVGNAFCFIAF